MDQRAAAPAQAGDVVLMEVPHRPCSHMNDHDVATLHGIGFRVARLLGRRFMSWYRPRPGEERVPFCIPADTLVGLDDVPIGGVTVADILGGVVPFAFVASKVISHRVLHDSSAVPDGWSHALADGLDDMVLPGYSAFSIDDARIAVRQLLKQGPVRIKPAWTRGGEGQAVARTPEEAEQAIASMDADRIARDGLVVEMEVAEPVTYSVGQIECGGITAAYVGCQRQTHNRAGEEVYGGSDLWVIRGTLADLEAEVRVESLARAIRQARQFDAAVTRAYPGFVASRRNYDLISGRGSDGSEVSGVLEQSWRVGGATPAEIAALAAFTADSQCDLVRAACHEVYGEVSLPESADIYFHGIDPIEGMLTKYSVVEHGRNGAPV